MPMQTDFAPSRAAIEFKNLSIKTDGTKGGTTITLNGKEIKNLASLNFSFYDDSYGCPVNVGITTREKSPKPGTMSQMTFWQLCPPEEEKGEAAVAAVARLETREVIPAECMPRDAKRQAYAGI